MPVVAAFAPRSKKRPPLRAVIPRAAIIITLIHRLIFRRRFMANYLPSETIRTARAVLTHKP